MLGTPASPDSGSFVRKLRQSSRASLTPMLRSRPVSRRGIKHAATFGLTLAAAVPAAASARVVEPVTVTKPVAVQAGQSETVTLRCPARAVALNATTTAPLAKTDSIPAADARTWAFRFSAAGSPINAQAALRCVRLRLPRGTRNVELIVGTQIQPVFEVPAGKRQEIFVRCPTGEVPTGWGLEHGSANNGLSLIGADPAKHGWLLTVGNTGSTGAAGTVYARCLEPKQRAGNGKTHAFDIRTLSFADRGTGAATHTCSPTEWSVATGLDHEISLTSTGVVSARGGEWRFSKRLRTLDASLICLSRTTGFRG
jgi:hypothetical protein